MNLIAFTYLLASVDTVAFVLVVISIVMIIVGTIVFATTKQCVDSDCSDVVLNDRRNHIITGSVLLGVGILTVAVAVWSLVHSYSHSLSVRAWQWLETPSIDDEQRNYLVETENLSKIERPTVEDVTRVYNRGMFDFVVKEYIKNQNESRPFYGYVRERLFEVVEKLKDVDSEDNQSYWDLEESNFKFNVCDSRIRDVLELFSLNSVKSEVERLRQAPSLSAHEHSITSSSLSPSA